jgi:hypothetical protein
MKPNELETTVATLLRLGGYDVKGETLIGYKKVDAYAEERRWGKLRRIAVECKLYARPLTQKQVSDIYSNYRPLLDSGDLDELLLVTNLGVAPSVETFVVKTRGLAHLTLLELQNTVIDFSTYLLGLSRQVDEDGLSSYYVKPKIAGDVDLETLVTAWIKQATRPLAILASYGMGKTSFARYMAAQMARASLADAAARIPIFVKLAEISAEQSLEGLLGRILATTAQVRHYSFDAFMELNSRGRFVIFLDGFDEMKHALTWDQFRFNFKEINRLATPSSRVILLGRPTAFLSDAEQQYVLHGIRRGDEGAVRDPNWPDYEEIQLQPFSRTQGTEFLSGYAKYLAASGKVPNADAEDMLKRIDLLPPQKLADLAARPVQLRILSEVLPQWPGDISELTLATLYSLFINMVIEREQEKVTRRRFDVRARRDFARELAFWLWTSRAASMSVDASRIPQSLFPPPKGDDTFEGVRRDMVSACFLDRKLGGALYFPHRSFQEFLVAERVVLDVRQANVDIPQLSAAVTPEVAEFVTQLAEIDDFERFYGALRRFSGNVSLPMLQAWMRDSAFAALVLKRIRAVDTNPWAFVLAGVSLQSGTKATSAGSFMQMCRRRCSKAQPRTRLVMLLASMVAYDAALDKSSSEPFLSLLLEVASASFRDFCEARRIRPDDVNARRLFGVSDFVDAAALRQIRVFTPNYPEVTLDLRQAFLMIVNELNGESMVLEWSDTARAAQAESLGGLQVTARVHKQEFRTKIRNGVSFMDLVLSLNRL